MPWEVAAWTSVPGLSFIKASGAQHGLQMGLGVHLEGLRGIGAEIMGGLPSVSTSGS